MPSEPRQQPLPWKADYTTSAQNRHRGVLERPAENSFLVDLKKFGNL
jgi:hypothetical protein